MLRLSHADKTLYGDEALPYRVGRQKQALQGHGAEQRRTARGDEAGSRDFLTVQGELHFSHRPDVAGAPGDDDRLVTPGDEPQTTGEIARYNDQSGAGIHQQFHFLAVSGRPGQACGYPKESHRKL